MKKQNAPLGQQAVGIFSDVMLLIKLLLIIWFFICLFF